MNDDIILEAYKNPETGIQNAEKLFFKLRSKGVTKKQIQDFLKKQDTTQVYKKPIKIKNYFPIYAKYKNHIFQGDLMDVSNMSRDNKGIHFLLVVIDIYTRFLYVEPLKNKTDISVTDAMKKILEISKPEVIEVDNGSEFISHKFKNLYIVRMCIFNMLKWEIIIFSVLLIAYV